MREAVNDINVLAQIYINPENSSRNIASECGISAAAVKKILKKYKYHDYKFQTVQKLHEGDPDRRLTFCNWFRRKLTQNRYFYNNILWTDETTFTNSGMFNKKNKHFYSTVNPHLTHQVRPQVRFSVNLWCGIIGKIIVGPKFIEGNLNSENYMNLLDEVFDETPLLVRRKIKWFMQDGCGPHNANAVRTYLNRHFQRKWLGTNGPVRWPPRSPCLNPLDYFLWGFLKNKVYYNVVEDVNELRRRIVEAFTQITPNMIAKATKQMSKRTRLCIQKNGGHFQQFL